MDRAALERLYRAAEYRVILPSGSLRFRVGRHDPQAESRLRALAEYSSWTIITPVNPRSASLCEQENLARLENFRRELLDQGRRWLPSTSADPAQRWPDEPGALIFDLSPEQARALGHAWQQNAVVRAAIGCAPELIWLDEA